MTRDEAIERISNITIRGAEINLSNYNAHFINVHTARDFLRKIYDDIESRTCSNCRWLFFKSETQPDELGWEERDCEANDSFIWKEPLDKWGCSNFERLEND